jgi:hypothetical protein
MLVYRLQEAALDPIRELPPSKPEPLDLRSGSG